MIRPEADGYWRESAGLLKEEAEREIARLQEYHRRTVVDARSLLNGDWILEERIERVLRAIEQRGMAALGAKV